MLGRVRSAVVLPIVVAGLLLPGAASTVNIDWVTVGDPGNACDRHVPRGCYGAVAYNYRISKYEITNAQYAEFLNAAAATDTYNLYNANMGGGFGGIARSGNAGNHTYSAITGREAMPVNFVSFDDSLRFSNWLHNGQGAGSTETGAYTLLGRIATPGNGFTATRNAEATIFLPDEDEWYKAAYFDGTSYFDYPAGTDTQIGCAAPGGAANIANCAFIAGDLVNVGSYTGSASPYGTFDQGGNVIEWTETIASGWLRRLRGGSLNVLGRYLFASGWQAFAPAEEGSNVGFRVASLVPEPTTALLLAAAMLGLAARRRRLH